MMQCKSLQTERKIEQMKSSNLQHRNIFDAQTKKLKDSYMTALESRNIINEVKPTMPWPPTSEYLNKKTAETLVPCSLYNFIAWTVGASEEPDVENFVQVTLSNS